MNKSLGFGPVIVLVLAVVIGTVVGLSLSRNNADLIDGVPVGTSLEPWPSTVVGAQVTAGGVTDGLTVLTLARGARPITIEDVRLEGSQSRLVGVRALGPDRKVYQFLSAGGFPSRYGRKSFPAKGTVVRPAPRGYQLLLGLAGSGSGFLSSRWLDVDYESDGASYVQRVPQTTVLCPTASLMHHGVCVPPPSLRWPSP